MTMLEKVKTIAQELAHFTGEYLEYDTEIPQLKISFNGTTVRVPMDFAEINNLTQDFLDELLEILREYEFE